MCLIYLIEGNISKQLVGFAISSEDVALMFMFTQISLSLFVFVLHTLKSKDRITVLYIYK